MCNIDKCGIYQVQRIIKSKWVVIIVYLLDKEGMKFNELKNSIYHISNEQLSKTLKKLHLGGYIELVDNNYVLTQRGCVLADIVMLMEQL